MEIDLYCERLGPGLLNEPVNALTNGAFFVAAWWAWRQNLKRKIPHDRGFTLLVILVVAIGFGSSLFHTTATVWGLLADVVPILLFQMVFLGLYLRRRLRLGPWTCVAFVWQYLAITLVSRSWPQLFNGSLIYAPTLLVLGWMGLRDLKQEGQRILLLAAGVFVISLTLRTVDQLICPWLATGTHPGWHLLNAIVLALACRALPPPRWQAEPTQERNGRSHGP